jgi:S1-C subfamily serine protease
MLLSARFVIPQIVEEMRYAWHRGELRAEYQSGRDGLRNVSLDALSDAYQMVTSAVGPSVAHIDVERRLVSESEKLAQQFFRGGMPPTDQGSGVIVDQDGYILTNRHVILGGESISVTLSDGRQLSAEVVGSDALTDLALLKIQADDLLPIAWGDSDDSKVGAPVWAVGSPFGLDRTITFGILSGKHRMVRASTQYQDFMQSDVAVNPGNSGGPLVNARGRLIGINTAIVGDTYQGVSFSIPSNVAKQVYLQLRSSGRVERGWLGVKLRDVDYDPQSGESPRLRGALVDYLINDEAPAAIAGMLEGDRIRSVNDVRIEDMAHLMRVIGSTLIGSTVSVQIDRGSEEIKLDVVLGARPSELNQQ